MVKKLFHLSVGAFFCVAGVNHFIMPGFYLRMIPPILPLPDLLNYISGAAEVLGGAMLFTRNYRRVAKWILIALLVAVFPANIYMALVPERFPEFTSIGLWLRLPFQILFIAAVYKASQPDATMSE